VGDAVEKGLVSVRAITKPPGFHWFGYYDKLQFSPDNRFVLGMETYFEHRRPGSDDIIKIGMIDTQDCDRWTELGESRAWCWQMGCMLQWRPDNDSQVMWNDRDGDRFACHIMDIRNRERRTLPFPFFTVHPDGRTALGLDFERLEYMRPGYGYAGVPDRNQDVLAPEDMGIYSLDLETGNRRLIISLADLAKIPHKDDLSDSKHYCNCLLFNRDGSRFAFLHRWRTKQGRGWPFKTRLLTANPDGSDVCVLVPGGCGHFNWKDAKHLIVQADGFWLYEDKVGRTDNVGKGILPNSGGHVSYLPGGRWIVGDTYPDRHRNQHLYLYETKNNSLTMLGEFQSPLAYVGAQSERVDDEWRCDLHPRLSREGRFISIDSPHGGSGRQIYILDIGSVVFGTGGNEGADN
jgi:hypothetical protein